VIVRAHRDSVQLTVVAGRCVTSPGRDRPLLRGADVANNIKCSLEGCDSTFKVCRGLCNVHYTRARREGTLPPKLSRAVELTCPHCGKAFTDVLSHVANGRGKHCSRKCWDAVRRSEPFGGFPDGMKCCGRCREIKALTEFTFSRHRTDGLNSTCKSCHAEMATHPEVLARRREIRGRRVKRDPDYEWKYSVKRNYNITIAQYNAMLAVQGGRCAICRCLPGAGGGGRCERLFVDHDHSCCAGDRSCGRCVRMLLCHRCNTGLGWLEKFGLEWWDSVRYFSTGCLPLVISA
jgi:hypothetical protein